jgi:hypothetical protein
MRSTSYNPSLKFHALSETLKRLGYANESHVKLYGQEFQVIHVLL